MRTSTTVAAIVCAVAAAMTPVGAAAAATWTGTTSKGGPIRECYLQSCRAEIGTFDGERMKWSHFANNPRGNRWYYVRDSVGNTGWMYCGNLAAGC